MLVTVNRCHKQHPKQSVASQHLLACNDAELFGYMALQGVSLLHLHSSLNFCPVEFTAAGCFKVDIKLGACKKRFRNVK